MQIRVMTKRFIWYSHPHILFMNNKLNSQSGALLMGLIISRIIFAFEQLNDPFLLCNAGTYVTISKWSKNALIIFLVAQKHCYNEKETLLVDWETEKTLWPRLAKCRLAGSVFYLCLDINSFCCTMVNADARSTVKAPRLHHLLLSACSSKSLIKKAPAKTAQNNKWERWT